MGEAKRKKLLDPNYGKPRFDPDDPNWVLSDEWDLQDNFRGTLASCLCCVGIESRSHFLARMQKSINLEFFFPPDFADPPDDIEFRRYSAIAQREGHIEIHQSQPDCSPEQMEAIEDMGERWTISYSPRKPRS
jgi:hypothetical protein